jgi:hypothetical protein
MAPAGQAWPAWPDGTAGCSVYCRLAALSLQAMSKQSMAGIITDFSEKRISYLFLNKLIQRNCKIFRLNQ